MSIRLRRVGSECVALCGYESDEVDGDLYIHDGFHIALAAKFYVDGSKFLDNIGMHEAASALREIADPIILAAAETQIVRRHDERDDYEEPCKDAE